MANQELAIPKRAQGAMKMSRGGSSSGWSERRQFRMTLIFVILAIILGLVAVSFLLARGTETLVNRAAKVAIGGPIKTAYTALHALDEQNIPLLQSCLSPPLRAKANRIAADWKWMTKDLGRVDQVRKVPSPPAWNAIGEPIGSYRNIVLLWRWKRVR